VLELLSGSPPPHFVSLSPVSHQFFTLNKRPFSQLYITLKKTIVGSFFIILDSHAAHQFLAIEYRPIPIILMISYISINFFWISSHVGTLHNEKVDLLAKNAIFLGSLFKYIPTSNSERNKKNHPLMIGPLNTRNRSTTPTRSICPFNSNYLSHPDTLTSTQ